MKEQTITTLHEMESTTNHVYHRVHDLLNSSTKMSIEELGCLTDIMKDCSETFKNICKIHHQAPNITSDKRI